MLQSYADFYPAADAILMLGQRPSRLPEADRCVEALRATLSLRQIWAVRSILNVHQNLTGRNEGLRRGEVVAGRMLCGHAMFNPIPSSEVAAALRRLELEARRLDPKDGFSHFYFGSQLLAVHPFSDGNGRTARLLILVGLTRVYGDMALAASCVTKIFTTFFPVFCEAQFELARSKKIAPLERLFRMVV